MLASAIATQTAPAAALRGFCPICAASHKLAPRGVLPRHGFSAKNVRHGSNGGFHIGGHGGNLPVGTAAGNETAIREAAAHDDHAAKLEAMPPATLEDAERAAIFEARAGIARSRANRGQDNLPTDAYRTADDFRMTSTRGWFYADALESRRVNMERARAAKVKAHREFAEVLRDLVRRLPA